MKKVVILGGGIGGLSAAHELVERGFAVEVYEALSIPGGKARSIPVPGTSVPAPHGGYTTPLPGEHGFRFFPRFYKHVVDTMSRIPYGEGKVVSDNLVDTTRVEMARYDGTGIEVPTRSPRSLSDVRCALEDLYTLFAPEIGISREDMAFFGSRIWQIITSCQERRMDEYEKLDWWDFIDADHRSEAYQKFLGYGITRSLVAAKARLASTKTIGDVFVQLIFDMVMPGPSSDRLLNGPTNLVWIYPWLDYLTRRGVQYHTEARVQAIRCEGGRIVGATIEKDGRTFEAHGDYYVAALPVERMAPLVTPAMLALDPSLVSLNALAENGVDWMIGIQLYLTHDVPITHGHTIFIDAPWALTSVSQRQFWPEIDFAQYADGCIRGILSVDISEWDQPGICGKTAKQCTEQEIKAEVWEQLKRSLNVGGKTLLQDDMLHSFYMPPDVYRSASGMAQNEEPLLVNLIDTWRLRPEAVTSIPNLFLASDYVRTYTDLATMEGANEAARRAVNGILDASGSSAVRCAIWNLQEPQLFAPWRELDRARYRKGLPWDDTMVLLGLSTLKVAESAFRSFEQASGLDMNGLLLQTNTLTQITKWASPFQAGHRNDPEDIEIRPELMEVLQRSIAGIMKGSSSAAGRAAPEGSASPGTETNVGNPSSPRVRSGRVRILP